jgi:His/Glu/Gln/Arg/opine family amino acid ABC transporter permease subunit
VHAVLEYWPALARGLWTTASVASCSILGAAIGALILGPLRLSQRPLVRIASLVFIEFIRGASAVVFLFWVFYALPMLPGMPRLSPYVASILVLSLVGASYGAEIVRAGIEAVHIGQVDACHALGLSKLQTLTKVVLPQALSQIVPGFSSLAADMVKWTSIVSFVGVPDVLYVANNIRSETYETVSIFCLLAALYWILCLISGAAFRALEELLPLNRALRATRASSSAPLALKSDAPAGVAR